MGDSLNILIQAKLNETASVGNINRTLKSIQSRIEPLMIATTFDENIIKTLNGFVKAMEKVKQVEQEQNKVVAETINIFKQADGVQKKVIQQKLKNGEIIEKTINILDEETMSMKKNAMSAKALADSYEHAGKVRRSVFLDEQGRRKGEQNVYRMDNKGSLIINQDRRGKVTDATYVNDMEKEKQATAELEREQVKLLRTIRELNRERTSVGDMVYSQNRYDSMSAKIGGMSYDDIKNMRHEIAEFKKDQKEALKDDGTAKKIQNENEQLQHQIELYKARTQVKADDLKRRYGKKVDQTELDAHLDNVNNNWNPSSLKEANRQIQQMNVDFDRLKANIKESGSHAISFGQQLKTALEKIPVWMAGMTIFYGTLHFFTEGIAYVNEMNKTLTEVSIVTGKSQEQVVKLGKAYQETAFQMGVTTAEFSKGAVEFYRQGLSDTDVMERLKTTTEYAKISNLDFKASAEILTATTNSMNISIERASDVFSFLGDATASGADEIGKAFQRVGGSAGALGIEFEKVSSWIATISSKTRESGETIGNSIKSILARIQNLKEKGFDEQDGTKINEVAKALGSVGVALTDDSGNFRDFGKVMDELGVKWGSLTNRQKAYVSTTVAGSYQQARFLNLMEGYDESVDLYKKSVDSAGTTQDKYNRYLEGTQAHLDRLKNAGEKVWMDSFDSKGIRNAIDALTDLVLTFDKLVKAGGIMLPMGIAISAIWLTWSKTGRGLTKMLADTITSIRATSTATAGATGATVANATATATATTATNAFSMAMVRAKISAIGLQAVVGFGLGAVLTAVGMLLGHVIGKMVEASTEAGNQKEQIDEITATYMRNGQGIDQLIKKYEELKSQDLAENQQELVDVQNKLAKLMPTIVDKIDDEGNARLKNRDAIQEEIKAIKELADAKRKETLGTYNDDFKDKQSEIEKKRREIEDLSQRPYVRRLGIKMEQPETPEQQLMRESKRIQAVYQLNRLLKEQNDLTKDAIHSAIDLNTQTDEQTNAVKVFNEVVDEKIAKLKGASQVDNDRYLVDATKQSEAIATTIEQLKKLSDVEKATGGSSAYLDSIFANLKNAFNGDEASYLKVYNALIDEFVNKTKKANNVVTELEALEAKMGSTFFDTLDKTDELNQAIEKLTNGHKLSYAEIKKLVKAFPELEDGLTTENGQLNLGVQALRDKVSAIIQEQQVSLDANKTKLEDLKATVAQELILYSDQIKGIQSKAEAQMLLNDITKQAQDDFWGSGQIGPAYVPQSNAIQKIGELADKVRNAQNGLNMAMNFNSATDDAKKGADAYTKALNELDLALQKVQNRMKKYPKSSEEYKNAIKEQIALTKQQIALADQVIANGGGGGSIPTPTSHGKATGAYADTINSYASQYGVDPLLVRAVAMQESSLGQASRNVMQVNGMDGSSPEESIRVGVQMLSDLLKQTNGDISKALAGYNMGAGILGYFNSHGGYSVENMKNFSEKQKNLYGYSGYGDVNYVDHVKRYYSSDTGGGSDSTDAQDKLDRAKKDKLTKEDALFSLDIELVNADLAKYEELLAQLDNRIKISEVVMSRYGKTTGDYRHELELQLDLLKQKQGAVSKEADAIRASGINTDEFNNKLKQLSASWWDFQKSIEDKTFELISSKLEEITERLANLDYWLGFSQSKMSAFKEGTADYNKELKFQIQLYKEKQREAHAEADLIREQIQLGDLNQAQKEELDKKLKELSKTWWDYASAINQANDELQKQKEQIADDIIQMYKDVYEKQKQVALDAIDSEKQAFDKLHEDKMKAYDDELKAYEDIVNAKLRALDDEASQEQFNKQLAEQNKKKGDITSQLDLLKLDNSMEAKAKRKQLLEELDSVNAQIEDLQSNRQRELLKQGLQDELEAKRKEIEAEKETSKLKLGEKEVTYEEGQKLLEEERKATETYYDNLINDEREFRRIREELMKGNVEETKSKLAEFAQWLEAHNQDIGRSITNNLLDKLDDFKKKLGEIEDTSLEKLKKTLSDVSSVLAEMKRNSSGWFEADEKGKGDLQNANKALVEKLRGMGMNVNYDAQSGKYTLPDGTGLYDATEDDIKRNLVISEMQRNSQAWFTATDEEKMRLQLRNKDLGESIGAVYDSATGGWTFPKHHDGDFVGGLSTSQSQMVNQLFNTKPNERIIKALEGELMIPQDNIAKNFLPNMRSLVNSIAGGLTTSVAGGDSTTNININIDKVIGDEKGADLVAKRIVDSFKKLGGKI